MADTTNTTTIPTAEVVRYNDPVILTERVAVSAFIAGYTNPTRRSYATDLRIFAGWRHDHDINLLNVKRTHLDTFARWIEQEGRMPSTINRRLSTCSSFYKYCQIEEILDRDPAANIRRPKVQYESRTLGLDRNELGALLVQAGLGDLRDVQEAASHVDPRTTMRYDRARRTLDRHATYVVSTFIAGATRPARGSPTAVTSDTGQSGRS